MATSPTQLSKSYFTKRGIPCEVTEKWVSFGGKGGIRRDVFGGDLQALLTDATLNVQASSGANHSARVKKCICNPVTRQWLTGTARLFWVMTWKKVGSRWVPRVTQINLVEGQLKAVEFTLK